MEARRNTGTQSRTRNQPLNSRSNIVLDTGGSLMEAIRRKPLSPQARRWNGNPMTDQGSEGSAKATTASPRRVCISAWPPAAITTNCLPLLLVR